MYAPSLRPQLLCELPLLCIHLGSQGWMQAGVSAVVRVVISMSQSLAELRF